MPDIIPLNTETWRPFSFRKIYVHYYMCEYINDCSPLILYWHATSINDKTVLSYELNLLFGFQREGRLQDRSEAGLPFCGAYRLIA